MPANTHKNPAWSEYAETLVDRLRKRHGLEPIAPDDDEPSELEILFQRFEGPETERFSDESSLPSRYVPARQLLTVIRLAATIGSTDTERACYQCGALTVISGIPVEDLQTVKDTLKEALPSRWQVIDPELFEGALGKTSQARFSRAVTESLDKIEPVLVLQVEGIALPTALETIVPDPLRFAAVTHDILVTFLEAGHLSDQITKPENLRGALPSEMALRGLSTVEICAALRAPALPQAINQLAGMAIHDVADGPRLEDMRGDNLALGAARRIVDDLRDWQTGKAQWHELSRSILFHGQPGTGKTFLAHAMAQSAGISFVTGSFGVWQSHGHLGDMLREMRATFAEARKKAPCILVIDEVDAVGSRNDDDRHATHYRVQVITTFLAEMDQIAHEAGVIVVGTCNHINRMDAAVLRAGRFDQKIEVPLPDAEAILEILRYHLKNDIADHELRTLSRLIVGKSAADIDAAIRMARSDARHARKLLTLDMLEAQMHLDQSEENRIRTWRIAVHEAGHAVAAYALDVGVLESIVITDDGGCVSCRMHPNESRLTDIEAQIAYTMAGRAAERLILSEISAGAGGPATSDLALATQAALDIETRYGLGLQGPVWDASPDTIRLANPGVRDRVQQRIARAETRAGKILATNCHFLEALARHLVEHRSMKAPEIARLLDGVSEEPLERPTETTAASN